MLTAAEGAAIKHLYGSDQGAVTVPVPGHVLSTRLIRVAGVGALPAPGTVLALPQIWVYARWISCPALASIENR